MELDRADEEVLLEKDPQQGLAGKRNKHQNWFFAIAFAANCGFVSFIAVCTYSRACSCLIDTKKT